jgi:probable F420-dependent oxidoreductase
MRFSVWPSFAHSWSELIDFAHATEKQGWHGLWYADHYMADTPDGSPSDTPALECWSMLAAFAAAVPRLQLGSLVSPSTVHHPALLAHQAATIDQISGGRVVLGIGAGWQVNEHRAYGIDLHSNKDRVDRFEEFIQVVRSLLAEARTTFAGTHFTMTDAPCEPKPIQNPLPIMVGSKGPRMLKIAARHADAWNAWGTPEEIVLRSTQVDAACVAVDRDPGTIRRTAQALFFLNDSPDAAAAIRAKAPADRTVVGGVDQMIEAFGAYAAAGVDELIVPDFTLGRDASERRDSYDRFWEEIIPAFR